MEKAGGSTLEKQIGKILQCHGTAPSHLLPLLREIQSRFHHVPPPVEELVAAHLSLPPSHVTGVVDFYHFLSHEPRGEFDILLSNCLIDQFHGQPAILQELSQRLETPVGSTRTDGLVSLGETSCSGLCDQGPAALVNGHAVPRLNRQRMEQMISLIESRTPVEQWPANMRQIDEDIRLQGPLLKANLAPGTALEAAFREDPETFLSRLEHSGLRGRGGAGFPTGTKWRLCRDAAGERYLVCNADEGEPGTFKDRELLRRYAHAVFEGMTLGAWVIGAGKGILYLRGEYLFLQEALEQVLRERREIGLLGDHIGGMKGFCFDITIRLGAGAYICGEESALLESLEGNRPRPRNRPPYPITHGFQGRPTLINNVETFATVPFIALYGSKWLTATGTERSPGSKLLSISGDCSRPGIYEFPFGTPIEEILDACGAASPMGVQVGGPSGSYITPDEFHRRLAFEDISTGGSFMVFSHERDLLAIVENFTRFFAHESCGFCTPCRVGTSVQHRLVKKIRDGKAGLEELTTLRQLGKTMLSTSHCGLGKTAPNPVLTTLEKEPQCYHRRLVANRASRTTGNRR